MSSPLSGPQIAALQNDYGTFKTILEAFRDKVDAFLNENAGNLDPGEFTELSDELTRLNTLIVQLAVADANTQFEDADSAFEDLKATTTAANDAAASLAAQVKQITRIANIAAGMIGLAAALASGPLAGVTTAITTLKTAIES